MRRFCLALIVSLIVSPAAHAHFAWLGHFCTLTMNVSADEVESKKSPKKSPEKKKEMKHEISASDLLANARSARNVWEVGFPGFSADVMVTVGSKTIEGKLRVSDEGELTWILPEGDMAKWAKSTLGSLVGHRMPTGDLGSAASYVDQARNHPLGRKISLDQDSMGSVYRVQDNTIRQVNREAGPSRFTITVLQVQRDERQRYLPTTFSVASWNRKTGALEFSLVAHHTFQRVGGYDLPKRLVEVNTGPKNLYDVKEIKLSNLRLNTSKVSAEAANSK